MTAFETSPRPPVSSTTNPNLRPRPVAVPRSPLDGGWVAYGRVVGFRVARQDGCVLSAATAACLAIERNSTARNVPIPVLQARLRADQQVLEWTGK